MDWYDRPLAMIDGKVVGAEHVGTSNTGSKEEVWQRADGTLFVVHCDEVEEVTIAQMVTAEAKQLRERDKEIATLRAGMAGQNLRTAMDTTMMGSKIANALMREARITGLERELEEERKRVAEMERLLLGLLLDECKFSKSLKNERDKHAEVARVWEHRVRSAEDELLEANDQLRLQIEEGERKSGTIAKLRSKVIEWEEKYRLLEIDFREAERWREWFHDRSFTLSGENAMFKRELDKAEKKLRKAGIK